jgi:predicted transcriptional regulator
MTTKEEMIAMIRKMPDDASAEDLLCAAYVRAKIDEGIRQAEAGQTIPHEEVMKRVAKWLN